MKVEEATRLKTLEHENAKLKRLLADSMLDIEVLKAAVRQQLLPVRSSPSISVPLDLGVKGHGTISSWDEQWAPIC
jgi:hypothetical protein